MTLPSENHEDTPRKRWYDQDPVLYRAMEHLRRATDKQQAQVALNIIKIIVEHQIEEETQIPPETLTQALAQYRAQDPHGAHRRWYDLHETLSAAIHMLSDCPEDLQMKVIPSISQMIERTLDQPTL